VTKLVDGIASSPCASKSDNAPKPGVDDIVKIGADAVFRIDVLKPTSPKGDAFDGAPGANTKKQMSLELDDSW
jgi:hypothetical protein